MKLQTVALITAAGSGTRYGGEIPKLYNMLEGKPVLRHAIDAFLTHPRVDGVRVIISRRHHMLYRKNISGVQMFPCVMGGETRQQSVRSGLESIARARPRLVLIHDAARPLVSHALIDRVLDALEEFPAVLPALAVADTLRRREGGAMHAVPRENLLAAQTPQGFHFDAILDAHRRFAHVEATDDIALAEAAGLAVGVVEGERQNLKLTQRDDFAMMQKLAARPMETRVGFGVDVHPFADHNANEDPAQRVVTLCGVKIPHEKRLHGHSDADAGLHALVDALLGAIGAGDIGQHFPADDPRWAGADSSRFLIHAYQMLKERGGEIVNIDLTFLGERPRIDPHRQAMARAVADLLKLDISRVNIKATTTEKLGFLGRSEGLAAQAVVSVKVPAS